MVWKRVLIPATASTWHEGEEVSCTFTGPMIQVFIGSNKKSPVFQRGLVGIEPWGFFQNALLSHCPRTQKSTGIAVERSRLLRTECGAKIKERFGTSKNFHVLCRMQKKVDLTPEAFNRLDEHHKKTKVEKKHFASEAIIEKLNKIGEKK